jgi:putative transcriptional regulator
MSIKYNRIKGALGDAGKTSGDLSKYLGVTRETVSNWCTNKNQPSVQDLYEISKFLKVDIRILLNSTDWK